MSALPLFLSPHSALTFFPLGGDGTRASVVILRFLQQKNVWIKLSEDARRAARVGHSTGRLDPDFAAQAEAAKAHAIDLLFTRCMQRCLEGDVEPIYWQGIVVVDHVRKFDSRLQIEMLRALMPNTF